MRNLYPWNWFTWDLKLAFNQRKMLSHVCFKFVVTTAIQFVRFRKPTLHAILLFTQPITSHWSIIPLQGRFIRNPNYKCPFRWWFSCPLHLFSPVKDLEKLTPSTKFNCIYTDIGHQTNILHHNYMPWLAYSIMMDKATKQAMSEERSCSLATHRFLCFNGVSSHCHSFPCLVRSC